MFNVRLRLAVFAGSTKRYSLVSLEHSFSSGSEGGGPPAEQQRQGGLYRGPALELLQPGGALEGNGGKHCRLVLHSVLQFEVPAVLFVSTLVSVLAVLCVSALGGNMRCAALLPTGPCSPAAPC